MDQIPHLAKVRVAGSNPVFRSSLPLECRRTGERGAPTAKRHQTAAHPPTDGPDRSPRPQGPTRTTTRAGAPAAPDRSPDSEVPRPAHANGRRTPGETGRGARGTREEGLRWEEER
jgi:hypothetical protein